MFLRRKRYKVMGMQACGDNGNGKPSGLFAMLDGEEKTKISRSDDFLLFWAENQPVQAIYPEASATLFSVRLQPLYWGIRYHVGFASASVDV